MRLVFGSLSLVLACALPVSGQRVAQQLAPSALASAPTQPISAPGLPMPDMTQLLLTLTDQPATHTGITFDRSMLTFAQGLLEQNGLDAARAVATITGVTVDTFHYQHPAFYTPEAMTMLTNTYQIAGWKHLVNANQTAASTAQPKSAVTDLWLHFSGMDIDSVTVLTRASLNMNVVRITGDLRPLDLLHLSGHFGIPKVDPSAVMVPDPHQR